MLRDIARLTDDDLHARLKKLAEREREATVEIVAHLAVLLGRKKHLGQRWPSVYTWCRGVLLMSEDAAYNRVAAARAVRRFPVILDHLAAGFVSVTAVRVLRPVLTAENHVAVLAEAKHRSRKDCERIVARLAPKPDVPSTIRALPAPAPVTAPSAPALSVFDATSAAPSAPPTTAPAPLPERRAVVAPLSPKRYRFEMTMDEEAHDALRQLQDLLATEVPNGDSAAVVKRALLAHLQEVRKRKRSATHHPRPPKGTREGSRDIPAHVVRAVWERDGERCAFLAKGGRRCTETRYLQLHHIHPYGYQGPATVENISVRCRAHNLYESELVYGPFRKPAMVREGRQNYGVSGRTRAVPGRKPDVAAAKATEVSGP